jgi:hypothetical protein
MLILTEIQNQNFIRLSDNPLIKQNTKNNNPIITRSAIYRNR